MTEEPQEGSTGAPFHGVTDWHAIDWKSANHNVRRLQARIVKATQEKKWSKVRDRLDTRAASRTTNVIWMPRKHHRLSLAERRST